MEDVGLGEPWATLISTFGPVAGLMAAAIITVVRGDWIPKKSFEREMAATVTQYEARIAQLKESHAEQLARVEKSEAEWKEIAVRSLDASEEATMIGKVLAQKNRTR